MLHDLYIRERLAETDDPGGERNERHLSEIERSPRDTLLRRAARLLGRSMLRAGAGLQEYGADLQPPYSVHREA